MSVKITFSDVDAVEVDRDDGSTLILYRTNLDGWWHLVWLIRDGKKEPVGAQVPAYEFNQILDEIRKQEAVR